MKRYFIICALIFCKLTAASFDTRLWVPAPGFNYFENLCFDTLHRTCFSLTKSVDIVKIMEREKSASLKWKNYYRLPFGNNAFDPRRGLTLVLLQRPDLYTSYCDFSHILDQIIGLWNFGGADRREEVSLFLIDGNSEIGASAWRALNAQNIQLISILYPNAEIQLFEEIAPQKPLRFCEALIADSSIDKKKCYPLLSQEKTEDLVSRLHAYYGIAPRMDEKIVVSYVRRYFPRQLRIDLEQELLRKIREIPNVDLRVVNFPFLSFKDRVAITARTDILLGVHDEALSHALFLPQGALFIELFPQGVLRSDYRMYAELRNVHYLAMSSSSGWCKAPLSYEMGSEEQLQALVTDIDSDAIVTAIRNHRRPLREEKIVQNMQQSGIQ